LDNKLYLNVKQTTSVPASVKFFKVPLPVQLSNGKQTKFATVTLWCTQNNQDFVIDNPGFPVKNVAIDPDKYIISSNNKTVQASALQAVEMPAAKITVSPNPVNTNASVVIENLQGKTQLQLFNNTGNVLWSKQLTIQERSTQIQIPFSSFINGNYRLLVTGAGGKQYSLAIVK